MIKKQKKIKINMSYSNFENSKDQIAITPSVETPDPKNETIQDIDYYKEKAEKLESELHKSKIQINKLESTITKLQSTLSSYTTSNNTSDSFLLTSEFKKFWISLGTENIMECFEHVFNRSVLLSHMVQETFLLTYQEANTIIENKITEMKKFFGVTDVQCTNDNFYNKIKPLFFEFFSSIFEGEKAYEQNITNIITKLGMSIYKRQIARYFNKEISLDLDSDNLKIFVQKSLKLCFYMHLHTPKLIINIDSFEKRELQYYYFNKYNYINLEGFEKEGSPCLLILPPPMLKNNYPFQGLKPFVYIIADPDEKVMECCEKHKLNNINSLKHSKSYGGECTIKNAKKDEDIEPIGKLEEKTNMFLNNSDKKQNNKEISSIGNNNTKTSPTKCIISSSSSSLIKNSNKMMMEVEENENKKPLPLKIPTTNLNNVNIPLGKLEHTHHQSRNTSRNIPLSNLNALRTHNIGKHFELTSDLNKANNTQQQNISIEKEINFDFICSTTTDNLKIQKGTQANTINNTVNINNTNNQNANSPLGVFNSDKSNKGKTKHVIKQRPKCFNVKVPTNNDTTITHDNSHLGMYSLTHNKSNSSSNSSGYNKRTHKKIVENILSTNTNVANNNFSDKINIVYKRIKKTMPMCFTNDLLKYKNSFTRTNNNSISVANGSGEVTTVIKKRDSGTVNESPAVILNYNNKKGVYKKK